MSNRPAYRRLPRAYAAQASAAARSNPVRTLIVAGIGLMLIWLVLTRSLAYAIAETDPEFAYWLNPNLPRALIVLADRERDKLLALEAADVQAGTPDLAELERERRLTARGNGDEPEDIAGLRANIRALTMRAIANAPMSARAYRMLAETAEDPSRVRALMQEALKRSRRESAAVFWLMSDSFERNDVADVVAMADTLLRTRPQLSSTVVDFLGRAIVLPEGRQRLVPVLASQPKWRAAFFTALPKVMADDEAPLDLMLSLKEAGAGPTAREVFPYLDALIARQRVDFAYNAWLQLLPEDKLAALKFLNNASFAEDPSGLPFDWIIRRGQNSRADLVPLPDEKGARGLRISFGSGRAKFPETRQLLLLAPGSYQLEGAFQGLLTGKRGLRWEIRCRGATAPLAETEMISGSPRNWQPFRLDVQVPDQEDCRAQTLRLYHHARSASEELISGQITFRGMQLSRIDKQQDPAAN